MPFFQHRRLTIWVRPIFSLLTLSNVMRHSTVVSTFATSPFILENNVLAEPRVDCGVETISVWIRTEKPFNGRLYIEDESQDPDCVHSYAKELPYNRPAEKGGERPSPIDSCGAEFTIRFGQCNMRRQRLLNPRGVTYSFTLVISFHPVFLTGIDRAFNIRCFFMEAVKALDAALNVSPMSTSMVERQFMLPQCSYHLKHGVDGPLLKYATIGEPITHVWACDPIAGWLYGALIHSCFVDDGRGSRFDLIDERGCVTDRSLLAEITYDEKSFTAYVHTHVFRYADRVQLFFTCTVQLCFREDGGCDGISPPRCLNIGDNLPSTAPSSRSISRELNFRPSRPSLRKPPLSRENHHFGSDFNGEFPPLKDSPLLLRNSNSEDKKNETKLLEQLLLADTLSGSDENIKKNHSRSGRNAAKGDLVGRMETDLSIDLTVVPRTNIVGMDKVILMNDGDDRKMATSKSDPFVRVMPIKNDEYNGRPINAASSLESQRFNSFEVLAIAAATFVTAITAISLITIICLNHSRLRRSLARKMSNIANGNGGSEIIIS